MESRGWDSTEKEEHSSYNNQSTMESGWGLWGTTEEDQSTMVNSWGPWGTTEEGQSAMDNVWDSEEEWETAIEEEEEEWEAPVSPLFSQTLICLPFSQYKSPHLETGDKVVMPPSCLNLLTHLHHLPSPLTFRIHAFVSGRSSHCGVLEFEADEGYVYVPDWMMANLDLDNQQQQRVLLTEAYLPKARFISLRPHTTSFYQLVPDPRDFLERELRVFTCLSQGDTFLVRFGNCDEKFYFDVVEMGPGEAVCMVDTDCELEFKMEEPKISTDDHVLKPAVDTSNNNNDKVFVPFMGRGRLLDEKMAEKVLVEGLSSLVVAAEDDEPERKKMKKGEEEEKKLFKAFTGRSHVLGR